MLSETHNMKQIHGLNQRGGRMLSIVDLLEDGTVDAESSAFLLLAMLDGTSFLTAANPSSAGKTTLMGALLNMLRPGVRIRTLASCTEGEQSLLQGEIGGEAILLAHEIGSGPYYSYLWGHDARRFFDLIAVGGRIASCMHADTLPEMREVLLSPPIALDGETFGALDLLLFMRKEGRGSNPLRRVSHIYGALDGDHTLLSRWERDGDDFHLSERDWVGFLVERTGRSEGQVRRGAASMRGFLEDLRNRGLVHLEGVRNEYLEFLGAGGVPGG